MPEKDIINSDKELIPTSESLKVRIKSISVTGEVTLEFNQPTIMP